MSNGTKPGNSSPRAANSNERGGGYNGLLSGLAALSALVMVACFGVLFSQSGHHGDAEGPAKYAKEPKKIAWPFDGIEGSFDRQAAQRGFQVYKEVCSACHGLKRVAFRNLADIGFSEGEIKALAAEYSYKAISDDGEVVDRPGKPSDHFPSAFANEEAARSANNGAYPPDLSLIVKARHDGPNYLYSLLTGYSEPPADFPMGDNMHYNPYFEGRQIAMAAPLSDGSISYTDGTANSLDQLAQDVVVFLQWAAEPELEKRKHLGIRTLIFLSILTIFFYIAKRRIWRNIH